jgi:DNA-binding transcriptional ArsR family regulator
MPHFNIEAPSDTSITLKKFGIISTEHSQADSMDAKTRGEISAPEDIALLASGVRQELVDTLAAMGGEASVGELANELGRPMDGLYYHLELLRKGGMVKENKHPDSGERRFRLAGAKGVPLRMVYKPSVPGVSVALTKFSQQLLHIAAQDFAVALALPGVQVSGPRRQLWISRNKGWVSNADLEEVNALLLRLGQLTSQPRSSERGQLVSLAFSLSPIQPKAKRRQAD